MTIEDLKDYIQSRAEIHAKAHQDFFKIGDHEMSLYNMGKEMALKDVLAHIAYMRDIGND